MTCVCVSVTGACHMGAGLGGDWLQAPNGLGLSEPLQHVLMRAGAAVGVSAFMFRVPLALTSDLCVVW